MTAQVVSCAPVVPRSEPAMNLDLIEHFKLDAQICGDHTLEIDYVSDRARGMRKARVEKRWYRERQIGQGAFGDVWLEVQKECDQVTAERAVKAIQKRRMESVQLDYRRELLALAKLSRYRELFVTLDGWYDNNDSVFLAMEYFPYGDLDGYIARGITEDDTKVICAQLLDGLGLMHNIGFTHRDLKPQNIFIVSKEPQWWVKIGDFGISKRVITEQTALRTQVGTQQFQAPEIFGYIEEAEETSEYTNAVDMWSLGCVIYLMLAQTVPFDRLRALSDYCSGTVQLPSQKLWERGVSLGGLRFIEELLNPHPSQRLAAAPASRHAWFRVSLPVEGKKDKFHGHEHQAQFSGPLQQSRSTEQTPEAQTHVGALQLKWLQRRPKTRASSERHMSADDTFSIPPSFLKTTPPTAVQWSQAVEFPTQILIGPSAVVASGPKKLHGGRKMDGEASRDRKSRPLAGNQTKHLVSSPDVADTTNRASEPNKLLTYPYPTSNQEFKSRAMTDTALQNLSRIKPTSYLAGSNIDVRDKSGKSALHLAAQAGQFDNLQWLLKGGADRLARDYDNNTALHLACQRGDIAAVRLLGGDSDVNLRGLNGDTPLHMASSRGFDQIISFLLANGANVNARNDGGQTPLHLAARNMTTGTVRLLLLAGADLKATDRMSLTAHGTAISHQNNAVAALLVEAERFALETPQPSLNLVSQYQPPAGGELREDQLGRTYYVDHNTRNNSWQRPSASPAYAETTFGRNSNIGIAQNNKNLRVTIVSATGLEKRGILSHPDPYAQVRIDGGKKEKTSFALSSRNPEWNDVLEFEVTEDSIIHAEVCDVFLFKLMGSMSVRVGDVIDLVYGASASITRNLQLAGDSASKSRGKLRIDLRTLPAVPGSN